MYLVHTKGSSPHAIDTWSKPYKTLAAAKATATRQTTYVEYGPYGKVPPRPPRRVKAKGNWKAVIYEMVPNDFADPTYYGSYFLMEVNLD